MYGLKFSLPGVSKPAMLVCNRSIKEQSFEGIVCSGIDMYGCTPSEDFPPPRRVYKLPGASVASGAAKVVTTFDLADLP